MQEHDPEDRKLQTVLAVLGSDERGATLIEYALVVGAIAIGTIVAMTSLRGSITTLFSAVGSQITSAT